MFISLQEIITCLLYTSDVLTGKKLTVKGYDKYEKEGLKDEENPLVPYNVTEPCIRKKVPAQDIQMEGRLIGGCLDVLTLFTGTKYDRVKEFAEAYKEDGIIWFLEACDLNTMGTVSYTHLRSASG